MRETPLIDVVSSRIRQRRSDRRLSLDKLAALAGVSKGMLVQIESGQANPSIATLCKVAAALGASVADLVQVSGQHPAEVLPAGAPRLLWRGPKGGSATLLVGSAGPDMLELWSWELRPGERYEAQAHPHGTEELIHVVRGRLSLAFGEVSYVIESGGSAVAHTDRPHAYACDGKRPVQFTMVVAEWHAPRREASRARQGARR
jgi:transcriptional regulator with XRE-family HTH domain